MNALANLFEKSSDPKDTTYKTFANGVTLVITKIIPTIKKEEEPPNDIC
jgi:hypothetical protein